ncbi:MAG TPA: PIG-L family deacetylase [Anaerolineales bacterium]|nr:PIG-L family deacetylase [Anaerolineales bacterium]
MNTISEVTVVIPAYNEANYIESILCVLRDVDLISEILVVDDGSYDGTASKVQNAKRLDQRIHLIQHPHNLGKGQAILTARNATKAPILLLLDADLVGLTPCQVLSLIEPVVHQDLDMTLGLFKGGQLLTDFSHRVTPWLTGQRCIRSSILDELDVSAASGYGFETALTLAAYRNQWRIGIVWLRGVWHPTSEIHHGLGQGIKQRVRMYRQIARAWHTAGGWSIVWRKTQKRILLFFFSLFLLGLLLRAFDNIMAYSAPTGSTEFSKLPVLTINNFHHILVIAPHPDDETLGAGGVIQQALMEGSQVKVVVVTNGDGQKFAPVMVNKEFDPRPQDYIAMGERRQSEVVAALTTLGMKYNDIVFLGYPDRGTTPIWMADWKTQCPYTAFYTRVKRNPYPDTYRTNQVYCGSNLVNDLQSIIEASKPDLIILPHPADQHPDHGAVSSFTRFAIAKAIADDQNYAPEVWGYLVHYGMFPQPRGKYFGQVLAPPRRLMGKDNDWGRLNLTPAQVALKYSAIRKYSSQNLLLGKFLFSFARPDELFESLPIQVLPPISFTALPVFVHGSANELGSDAPSINYEEFPIRGDLLTGWQTARLNDKVWLDLQMKRDILPDLDCTLYLKLPDGQTKKMNLVPIGPLFSSRDFVAQIDITTLGKPSVLAFAAEVRQGRFLISKTGWHILVLE